MDGEMLNSGNWQIFFEGIWKSVPENKKVMFEHFDSIWFNTYASGKVEKAMAWIKKKNIMDKQYVIIPIVHWGHWTLLILCGFNRTNNDTTPCMILLDSLQSTGHNYETLIRSFEKDLYRTFGMQELIDSVHQAPLLKPNVPQQKGGVECGYYALYYASLFMHNAPEQFSIMSGYPYFMKRDWFTFDEFKVFREHLSSGILVVVTSQNNELTDLKRNDVIELVEHELFGQNVMEYEAKIANEQFGQNDYQGLQGKITDEPFGQNDEVGFVQNCENQFRQIVENDGLESESTDGENGEESSDGSILNDSENELDDEDDDQIFDVAADEALQDFDKKIRQQVKRITKSNLKGKTTCSQESEHEVNIAEQKELSQRDETIGQITSKRKSKTVMKIANLMQNMEWNPNKKNNRMGVKGPHASYMYEGQCLGAELTDIELMNEIGCEDVDALEESDDEYFKEIAEEDAQEPGIQLLRFNAQRDIEDPHFENGMLFNTKRDVLKAIKIHSIKWGRNISVVKNDHKRVRAVCKAENCTWVLYAAQIGSTLTFQIKTLQPQHSCSRDLNSHNASSRYIAAKYIEDFRSEKGVNVGEFQEKVHREMNINIKRSLVYKIKLEAKSMIEGSYRDQYKLLWDYCEEIRVRNPGSSVYIDAPKDLETGLETFQRIYVCLQALKIGFLNGCRKVIGLDGTFLKGPHKGILLTAVGIDANNGIFPIAWAVVELESKFSWRWFLERLVKDLRIYKSDEWCIVSDRQKGLIEAVVQFLPESEHRYCVRHLHNNFKKHHLGEALKEMLWNCAKSTYQNKFELELQKLRDFDESAYKWLIETTSTKHWARCKFRTTSRCDLLLNNHSETFNRQILSARAKPILGLLEKIRSQLMLRNQARRSWIHKQEGNLCPRIAKKLDKLREESAYCIPSYAGAQKFQVKETFGSQEQFSVDTSKRVCTCRKWELTGIPCKHAMAAIGLQGKKPENYVDHCYSRAAYLRAYEPIISPCNGPNNWPKSEKEPLQPPNVIRLPGRPKMKRRLEPGEPKSKVNEQGVRKLSRKGAQINCRVCQKAGHNGRRCSQKSKNSVVEERAADPTLGHNLNQCKNCGGQGHNGRGCNISRRQEVDPAINQLQSQNSVISTLVASNHVQGDENVVEQSSKQPKKRRAVQCSRCGQPGHNKATCRLPPPVNEKSWSVKS